MRKYLASSAILLLSTAIVFHVFKNESIAEVIGVVTFWFLLGAALAPDYPTLERIKQRLFITVARAYDQYLKPLFRRVSSEVGDLRRASKR